LTLPTTLEEVAGLDKRTTSEHDRCAKNITSERDGPYLLLRGFQKLLACVNTLAVFKRYGQLDALLKLLDAL